jgi:hypothetical protein
MIYKTFFLALGKDVEPSFTTQIVKDGLGLQTP